MPKMKMEHKFKAEIESKLTEKNFDHVLAWLKSTENAIWVKANVWNLISRVCLTVKIKELLEDDSDVQACRSILVHLVDIGNPKEVIVALMEEADSFKSHPYFCLLLEPLRMGLKNVPGKRGKSLEWVLSTLNAHLHLLPPPEDQDLQGEERLLLDTDPAVIDACYVLTHYLPFVDAFVDEVSIGGAARLENPFPERVQSQREILTRYLLILLNRPFLYHDLHADSPLRPKSTIRVLCENCVTSLSKICPSAFTLFRYDAPQTAGGQQPEDDDEEEDDTVPQLSLANLSYLIFVEDVAARFVPRVFNHLFLFKRHLKYVLLLLEKKENLVLFKGLRLAEVLLERLEDAEISYGLVELAGFADLSRRLLGVAVFSQFEEHRKAALRVFLLYVDRCDWKGRYHLVMQALDTSDHSGCQGLAINIFRRHLHDSLCGRAPPGGQEHFFGPNLARFLRRVFSLRDGVETDVLENLDRIVTSLNLLRYLLLRDPKDENTTGVWSLLPAITKKFLDPLLTALDMSRAHYKQAAIDYEAEQKKDDVNPTVTVNEQALPNVPPHFQKDMLEKALVTFDMVESILSRVRELL